jgi:hypothetical protein
MKTTLTTALVAVLGALTLAANAQDTPLASDARPEGGPEQRGPGMGGQRPPLPLIVRTLDANHDGVIDATEMNNATAALKALDKNGDGKLTVEEFMGPRPQLRGGQTDGDNRGPSRQGRSPGGPGGDDRRPHLGPPPGEGNDNQPPAGPPPADN